MLGVLLLSFFSYLLLLSTPLDGPRRIQYSNLEACYVLKDWKTIKLSYDIKESAVLAFKFAMQRRPGAILVTIYWVLILCITYVVRLGEGPARLPHSAGLLDQV